MKTMTLATFSDNVKAHMLQDMLHNEGIESFLRGETLNQVLSCLHGFEVHVVVFEKDADRALSVLKDSFPEACGTPL